MYTQKEVLFGKSESRKKALFRVLIDFLHLHLFFIKLALLVFNTHQEI